MKKVGDNSKILITYQIIDENKNVIFANKRELIKLSDKNSLTYILKTVLKNKEEKYTGSFFIKEKSEKESLINLKKTEYPGVNLKLGYIVCLGVEDKIYGYIKNIEGDNVIIDIEEPFFKKNIEIKINILKIIEE